MILTLLRVNGRQRIASSQTISPFRARILPESISLPVLVSFPKFPAFLGLLLIRLFISFRKPTSVWRFSFQGSFPFRESSPSGDCSPSGILSRSGNYFRPGDYLFQEINCHPENPSRPGIAPFSDFHLGQEISFLQEINSI